MDATMTGRSYRPYSEWFPALGFEYADDTAIIFQSRANIFDRVTSTIQHFAHFGTGIRKGLIYPKGESKTVIYSAQSLYVW